MAETAKTRKLAIASEDIQRARIEGKIAKEEADLKEFQDRVQAQVRDFIAQSNAEIAARTGRIQVYRELLGLAPETDTSPPAQNAQEGPQEAPSGPEVPEPSQSIASAA